MISESIPRYSRELRSSPWYEWRKQRRGFCRLVQCKRKWQMVQKAEPQVTYTWVHSCGMFLLKNGTFSCYVAHCNECR